MSWLSVTFMVIVFGVMPVLAIRSARQLKTQRVKPTVQDILVSTLIVHGVISGLAIAAANANGISLFPRASFTLTGGVAAVVFLFLALLANIWRWRLLGAEERDQVSWLRPQGRADIVAWAGISLLAGVAEEIIYRGALFGLVQEATGNEWASIGLCIVAFALGHWVQGRGAMLIVVLFAAGFHVLVRITGDLYTAIIVHVVYDFVAGVILLKLSRQEPERLRNSPAS